MPSAEDVRVRFKRGEKDAILAAPVTDGMFYVSTDTNEMFLDSDTAHNQIGGGLTEIPIATDREPGAVCARSMDTLITDPIGDPDINSMVCVMARNTDDPVATAPPLLTILVDESTGFDLASSLGEILRLKPATPSSMGGMSAEDKAKLDGLENSVNVAIQGSQPTDENIKIWISG